MSAVAIHLLGSDRAQIRDAVVAGQAKRGFERVDAPARGEPLLERVRLVPSKERWTTLVFEDLDSPDAWAKELSRKLGLAAIGSWYWEDEGALRLTLFERGKKTATLALPDDAQPDVDDRVRIPLGPFSRFVAGVTDPRAQLDVRVRGGIEDGEVIVPGETFLRAISRVLAIGDLFPDPVDEDLEGELIHFRPRPDSIAGKQLRSEQDAALAERRAAHDARVHAIGWLAFAARSEGVFGVLEAYARPLASAFDAALGERRLEAHLVDPKTGQTRPVPPPHLKTSWKLYVEGIVAGSILELTQRDIAAVWAVLREEGLSLGWSFRGPKDADRRVAIARAMDDAFDRAARTSGCFGGLVGAQATPTAAAAQAIAWEYLRERSRAALRPAFHRTHPRAPGWRVLVPKEATPPSGALPAGFTAVRRRAGLAIASEEPDPWALAPAKVDALEQYLEPSLGTLDEPA